MSKQAGLVNKSIGEQLKEVGSDIVKGTTQEIKNIGSGFFQQLLGLDNKPAAKTSESQRDIKNRKEMEEQIKDRVEQTRSAKISSERRNITIFSFTEYRENVLVKRRIEALITEIRKEVEQFRQTTSAISTEIEEIAKTTLSPLPEKVGVYHIRFLEFLLSLIKNLRAKTADSKSWLEALVTRKKKRGSLFAAFAKKKGTQYSLSEELKLTRSTQ